MKIRFNLRTLMILTAAGAAFLAAQSHIRAKTNRLLEEVRVSPEKVRHDLGLPVEYEVYGNKQLLSTLRFNF